MELYHGAHTDFTLHTGICFTDSVMVAANYAGMNGEVGIIEADLSGLEVVDLGLGYNHDENVAAGDDGEDLGADVLIYDDEDINGRIHTTWRLMTEAAVAKVTIVETLEVGEFEAEYR
jgi:hypothetical protein